MIKAAQPAAGSKRVEVPAEQMQTVHRDAKGKIVSLEEKLISDKDRLQKTNKQALATWAQGAKQKELAAEKRQALEEAKQSKFGNSVLDPAVDRELKDKDRLQKTNKQALATWAQGAK